MFGSLGELKAVPRSRLERFYLRKARLSRSAIWTLVVLLPAAVYQAVVGAHPLQTDGLLLAAFMLVLADYFAKDWVLYRIVRRQAEELDSRAQASDGDAT